MSRHRPLLTACLAAALSLGGSHHVSAQAPPGTDIWILEMDESDALVRTETTRRVTDRAGYDNQPHFLPGETHLLFTSIDEAGQADIYRFDLNGGTTTHLTDTRPESEYSATLMPAGDRFSVIRVEADSTQRLWSFDLRGQNARVLVPHLAPVGYHTWFDNTRLALFVLGSPATLHLTTVESGPGTSHPGSEVVAENIGRSLHTIPGSKKISFVQWENSGIGWITELDPETGQVERLAPLLEGNEFYAWTPTGTLITGKGSRLYRWTPGHSTEWQDLVDLGSQEIEGISRIAVNPEGTLMAVVGAHR